MSQAKKTFVRAVLVIGIFAIMGTVFADIDVSKFKNPKEFKGKVVSLCTTNVKMGIDQEFKGRVNYVVPPGTFFRGPIVNKKGEMIRQGTLLAGLEGDTLKANLKQVKAELDTKKAQHDRYMRIVEEGGKGGAISEQDFLAAKNDYLAAEAKVIIAENLLETTKFHARFDGVVTKLLFPGGYTTEPDRDVLEVKQLVPIGVKIQMSDEGAAKCGVSTPVAIFPLGSKKAVGPFRGATMSMGEDSVVFVLRNNRNLLKTYEVDGKQVPVVTSISPVVSFLADETVSSGKQPLSVNMDCLLEDPKGEYIMVVEGQSMTAAFDPVFKLKKVYIKTVDEINPVESSVKYIRLENSETLKENQIVLTAEEAKGLKTDDTVYYSSESYLFMPGDPVKVIIDIPASIK
jgi:hypothetical protein